MSTSETPPPLFRLLPCLLLSSSPSSLLPLAKAGAAPNPSASTPPPTSFAEPLKKVRRELRRWCGSEGPSSCSRAGGGVDVAFAFEHALLLLVVVSGGPVSNHEPTRCGVYIVLG